MKGQLSEHPLAELISEIAAAQLSGALRLERERVKVAVYFESGELIHAASNVRAHRLHEIARRSGIAEQHLAQAGGDDASTPDARFGAALIEMKVLTTDALEKLLVRQALDVLRLALLWIDGSWQFEPRARLVENARIKLDWRETLIESTRRLPIEFIASRFSNATERFSPGNRAPVDFEFLPTEAFLLSRIDAPVGFNELIAVSGISEAEALKVIYTLALGDFLQRDASPRAFSPEEVTRMLEVQANLAQTAKQKAAAKAQAKTVVSKSAETKTKIEPTPEEDAQKALEDLFARLERATDHYGVLGITRRATTDEIKRTYHSHAKRFHPDRFHSDADKTVHARVETAFARIAQAYEVLKDNKARAAYDLKLNAQQASARMTSSSAASSAASSASAGHAENSFQEGVAALEKGNHALAAARFSEAARLEPQQARYHAFHGRALAGNVQTRHQAEAKFNAAIALDARNASYRVMLAEFFRDVGLLRRAEGEIERALAIEPQNESARRLLKTLRDGATTART